MVKPVDKTAYRNYLKKAEEMLEVAKYVASRSRNTAAVTNAIHSAINGIDALAMYYVGKRHSARHEDAIDLIRGILNESEFKEVKK